jgi:hypothetical protein
MLPVSNPQDGMLGAHGQPEEVDLAGAVTRNGDDHADCRRLSRSVRPYEAVYGALRNDQGKIVHGPHGAEGLCDGDHFNCCHDAEMVSNRTGGNVHFPIQNVEKIRLRMSSAVVAPVIASIGRRAP